MNGPYEEPSAHWWYHNGVPIRLPERRAAMYFYKTKKVGAQQQELLAEKEGDRLELVNRLRQDVRRWREVGYRGASKITRDLFAYWFRSTGRRRRLFFCQREAVETVIYLLELAIPGRLAATGFKRFELAAADLPLLLRGERPSFALPEDQNWPRLCDLPSDPRLLPLRRLGCKMATGSGKTLVMAMIITWGFLNRSQNLQSAIFPNGVLICAPNLTVRKRLQVLKPEDPNNYYKDFELIPPHLSHDLSSGKVLITNWHAFAPKSEHREGDQSYLVVQKGEESPAAFTEDRLGELAKRLPILVLNDEGHHCWRPSPAPAGASNDDPSGERKKELEEDAEEARVWLAGLDRINNSGKVGKDAAGAPRPGVLAAIDLSATPFYLGNSGYPEGSPFPWLVSDFGLVDAIECGIVKTPRLPGSDDKNQKDEEGRPDPKYFRLWHHILQKMNRGPGQRLRALDPAAAFQDHGAGAAGRRSCRCRKDRRWRGGQRCRR